MAKENKHIDVDAERLARKKKKKRRKVVLIVLVILLLLILVIAGAYFGLRAYGKYQLQKKGAEKKPALETMEDEDIEVEALEEGSIRYQGKVYTYNENIMNIVFMGIDQHGELQEGEGEGGRSDLVILAVVDNRNRKVTLFNINRNTMTEIAVYDESGDYLRQSTGQLALAHAYGDGKEQSAQLVCDAVSNLMYGLPVHGYCALNLDAIPLINDTVGGVTVTLLDDFTDIDSSYVKGAEVTLKGDAALAYVQHRDISVDESNEARMERQKQYMRGFLSQTKRAFQEDMTMPVSLYQAVAPYMVTDISIDQVTYLVTQVLGYEINTELQSLPGTVQQGALYEEYYVNEPALYEMIIQTFYVPTE